MPFDLGLCKAAPEKFAVHPQPRALSWGSRNSFWRNQHILDCIRKLASLPFSSISSFCPFYPDFFSLLPFPPSLSAPPPLAFIFSRMFHLIIPSLFLPFFLFCCFLSSSPSSQWLPSIISCLELSFSGRGRWALNLVLRLH